MKKLLSVFLIAFCIQLNLGAQEYKNAGTSILEEDIRGTNSYKDAVRFKQDIRAGKLAERTDTALDNIIVSTVRELKKRKETALATEIETKWRVHKGFITRSQARGFDDLGDHEGIAFLADIHSKIHFVLGTDICRALRTHDLFVLAYAIPVVFRCVDKVGAFEYERHFNPLVKVVGYWLTYGVCVAATSGTGIVYFCGLVAMIGEQACGSFVAPALLDFAYGTFCKDAIVELPGTVGGK